MTKFSELSKQEINELCAGTMGRYIINNPEIGWRKDGKNDVFFVSRNDELVHIVHDAIGQLVNKYSPLTNPLHALELIGEYSDVNMYKAGALYKVQINEDITYDSEWRGFCPAIIEAVLKANGLIDGEGDE